MFLHKNYPITKKSKGARMGKGKGNVVRYGSRIFQNHNLFEFCGFSLLEIINLKRIFRKKINIPIKIYSYFFRNKFNNFHNLNLSNINFEKYNK